MLNASLIRRFYLDTQPNVPDCWRLSRKHFRVETSDGRFVKLNKHENRLSARDLWFHCWKLAPLHAYFSVLNWLFPERVGKKYKARYCTPLNGEYVIDIDSHIILWKHNHNPDWQWHICEPCLDLSKTLTLQVCQAVENYYSHLAIVFSGRAGFHVHVMDFDYHDWVPYSQEDPVWCHEASRFKLTKLLQVQTHVFDRDHFTLSCDPMRVVTVPNTLNGQTGLVCSYVGGRKDLEKLSVAELLERSKPFSVLSYPEPHFEAVKTCAKNPARAA